MVKEWAISAALLAMGVGSGCSSSGPRPLYDRLGGEQTISVVVEDFVGRAAGDPKVNFTRKGTSAEWNPTPENVDKLKKHLTEFLEAASGGSQEYNGRDMKSVHAGMQITNNEFDAIEADLSASLSKYDVPPKETSELIAIIEGTRKDIVELK